MTDVIMEDNIPNDLDIIIEEQIKEEEERKKNEIEKKKTREKMKIYYENYYPCELITLWLGKNNQEYFERREFSFTSERYIRFQCYKTYQELKTAILKFVPEKIDIGAVYNTLPKMHNQISADPNAFKPVEKELIFDIDMTDYDDIRTCCKEAKICDKCWKYMIVAYKILNDILREDFGFEKLLWVFSGRRGIHCWICDDRARKLNDDGRCAIANFMKFKFANVKLGVTNGLREPIHPTFERSITIIEKYFNEIALQEQNILNFDNGKELLLGLIKSHLSNKQGIDDFIQITKQKVLDENYNSEYKFNKIFEDLSNFENFNPSKFSKISKTEIIKKDFMMNILFPRLDINVSKHLNHLLKSPFCVHPKSGMVSVPLDEDNIINFKVENIPKINEIYQDKLNGM